MIGPLVKSVLAAAGYEIHRIPIPSRPVAVYEPPFDKIHYACGRRYLPGWLNVDIIRDGPDNYRYMNLVEPHPFPDNYFRLALCEDFIEHVDQASSLLFLYEAHRTLRVGGVLRISSPEFGGVLARHFPISKGYDPFAHGRAEAYAAYGHIHFFSPETLTAAARHIGFSVAFVGANESADDELRVLSERTDPIELHAELTKL